MKNYEHENLDFLDEKNLILEKVIDFEEIRKRKKALLSIENLIIVNYKKSFFANLKEFSDKKKKLESILFNLDKIIKNDKNNQAKIDLANLKEVYSKKELEDLQKKIYRANSSY